MDSTRGPRRKINNLSDDSRFFFSLELFGSTSASVYLILRGSAPRESISGLAPLSWDHLRDVCTPEPRVQLDAKHLARIFFFRGDGFLLLCVLVSSGGVRYRLSER